VRACGGGGAGGDQTGIMVAFKSNASGPQSGHLAVEPGNQGPWSKIGLIGRNLRFEASLGQARGLARVPGAAGHASTLITGKHPPPFFAAERGDVLREDR
jgi:hypothetical protein